MNRQDKEQILSVIGDYLKDAKVREMKDYIQHGDITTYKHCVNVVKLCYLIDKKFELNADREKLLTAALLHDFYLYDWHDGKPERKIHGYTHPRFAAENAIRYYDIDEKTADMIRTHMWPLTLRKIPKSKEAWILCIADKISSTAETLWMR